MPVALQLVDEKGIPIPLRDGTYPLKIYDDLEADDFKGETPKAQLEGFHFHNVIPKDTPGNPTERDIVQVKHKSDVRQ